MPCNCLFKDINNKEIKINPDSKKKEENNTIK